MATYFPSPDFLREKTAGNFAALYPEVLRARANEINQYGGFLRANQSPYVTQSLEQLMKTAPIQVQQVGQTPLGTQLAGQALAAFQLSPLQQTLQSQALGQLSQGSGLSLEDQRAASQAANAAYAARGMAMGNSSASAEILNRYNLGQQRLDQRQRFGLGVDQQLQAAQNTARSFALGVDQQDLQRQQFNSGLKLSADQTNQNFLLGRTGMALQQDPARAALHGPTMVMPTLGIGVDMANTTYNAGVAQHIAAQNREAALQAAKMQAKATRSASRNALIGTGIGALGSVAGAGISAYAGGIGIAALAAF